MNGALTISAVATVAATVASWPAGAQTTTAAAFTHYLINGGACTGLHASDRAVLDNRAGSIANVGNRTAIVTCHAPLLPGGHFYAASVYLRFPTKTDSQPFSCTLFTGSTGLGGVLRSYPNYGGYNDGQNFELAWGMSPMEEDITDFSNLADSQYPIQGQPLNVQCKLPPKTRLDSFEFKALQDQPRTINRTT